MRLLSDMPNQKSLDLDIHQLSIEELDQHIQAFKPDVIFALSDDENETILEFGLRHWCHMGFFKPQKHQLDEGKLEQSRRDQLAKILFLDKNHPNVDYFDQCGRVIYTNYLEECHKLLNFIFFCDASD